MKTNPDDYPIRNLLRSIDAVEAASLAIAMGYDGRIPSRVVSALRETVAIAKVRAEDLAIESEVDLAWARTPDEPDLDPYEGWLDYGIIIDGAEVNVRTSPEDAERLVACLGKAEADRDLDHELKRAQLKLVNAKLADRKSIETDVTKTGSVTIIVTSPDGEQAIVSQAEYDAEIRRRD